VFTTHPVDRVSYGAFSVKRMSVSIEYRMESGRTDNIFIAGKELGPVQLEHGNGNARLVWVRHAPLNNFVFSFNHNNILAEIGRCHEGGRIDEFLRNDRTGNECQERQERSQTHFGREALTQ
jgi:hypothetical protein